MKTVRNNDREYKESKYNNIQICTRVNERRRKGNDFVAT